MRPQAPSSKLQAFRYPGDVDHAGFRTYLREGGRSPSATDRVISLVSHFETYLAGRGLEAETIDLADLEGYVEWYESEGDNAKIPLWAISYLYEYLDDIMLEHLARELREERVRRDAQNRPRQPTEADG